MVFFSSCQMLEDVAVQFQALCEKEREEIELLCQTPGMTETQREEFLERFEAVHPQGLAGFCVMGGIFGEGIVLRKNGSSVRWSSVLEFHRSAGRGNC